MCKMIEKNQYLIFAKYTARYKYAKHKFLIRCQAFEKVLFISVQNRVQSYLHNIWLPASFVTNTTW